MHTDTGNHDDKRSAQCSAPPGVIWRRPLTGGYYWRLAGKHLPVSFGARCEQRYAIIPLVPAGKRVATKNRAIAEARRQALWRRWHTGRVQTSADGLLDRFERDLAAGSSVAQARSVRAAVEAFLAAREHHWDVTDSDVQQHINNMVAARMSPRTIKRHVGSIRRFYAFAAAEGACEPILASKYSVRLPRLTESPPPTMDAEEVLRLLDATDRSDLRLAVRLALSSGLRLSELVALRPEDFLEAAVLVGAARPTKTGGFRAVPVPRALLDEIRAAGGRIVPTTDKGRLVDRLRELAGDLPAFAQRTGRRVGRAWHVLRYTWTNFTCRGLNDLARPLNQWELMQRGGWNQPTTPMRHYLQLATIQGPLPRNSPMWKALGFRPPKR